MFDFLKKRFATSSSVEKNNSLTQEQSEELLGYIQRDVSAGFLSPEEIVDSAVEALSDQIDPNELQREAERITAERMLEFLAEQANWPSLTDCDRLDNAFSELERLGIISRHNFTCCGTCGAAEIGDEIGSSIDAGRPAHGYAFYHMHSNHYPAMLRQLILVVRQRMQITARHSRSSTARGRLLTALSPVLLIGICVAAQHVFGTMLGIWAWVPTMLLFWVLIAISVKWSVGAHAIAQWLQPAQGAKFWSAIGLGVGLLSLHGFLSHWQILRDPLILSFWLTFALINPWFEEAYWRGLLMDATESWGAFLSIAYSAVWFALSHPLIWGVHSTAMRQWPVVLALLFVGAIWGLVYHRTRSLRWTIAGHMLANLLGLAVPVLLNMYNPAAR